MPDHPRRLEEPYRARAVPAGSGYYFSWLFAAPAMRAPLLGVYALLAEWRALSDAAVEPAAAHLKLAWWREEIGRLGRGAPLHPIGRYLASLPRAPQVDFSLLERTLAAADRQIGGVPVEHGADLEAHAAALRAEPLALAARLAAERPPELAAQIHRAECALAAADYLRDALASYRRAACYGRVLFPVDELLAAKVENADLTAVDPPVHLQSYLEELRRRTTWYCSQASAALPRSAHEPMRHLLVLAALGARPASGGLPLRDLYLAWSTARRAARQA